MNRVSSTVWRSRGSSLIVDRDLLAQLAAEAATAQKTIKVLPLREALLWSTVGWTVEPPGNARTLLVVGLDALLDHRIPAEAEAMLRQRIMPLIQAVQRRWPQSGLLFALPIDPARLSLDSDDRIRLAVPGSGSVALSWGLWNGAAEDVAEIVASDDPKQMGYYNSRLS
jgi:hypothetical protein